MKIPENAKPYRAIVNGVEHVYEAGADVEVAPGVEELIEAADNFPAAPDPVVPPFAGGGGGGSLVVTATIDPETSIATLDKTWQEIYDSKPIAMRNVFQGRITQLLITAIYESNGGYTVQCSGVGTEIVMFETSSASGYPSAQLD